MKKLTYKPQENSANEVFFANKEELIKEIKKSSYVFARSKSCKEIYLLDVDAGGSVKLNFVNGDARMSTGDGMNIEYLVSSYDLISINDEELGAMLFN